MVIGAVIIHPAVGGKLTIFKVGFYPLCGIKVNPYLPGGEIGKLKEAVMETALAAAVAVVGTILGVAVIFWVQRELKKQKTNP